LAYQREHLAGDTEPLARPVIKPSNPSGPFARARLGGVHARFGLLGGASLSVALGSVRPSRRIGCSGSVWLQPCP